MAGAILVPLIACGIQWLLWDVLIKPYVWLLLFPAAFMSVWLGGLRGGLAGTVVGATVPPLGVRTIEELNVVLFVLIS